MPIEKIEGMVMLGDSLLFTVLSKLIVGAIPANHDIFLHPVALAGWIGFFVTSLNLIPVGQLDGGHILYALIGERHVRVSKVLIGVLVVLGVVFYEGWIVWAVLLLILGFRHPPIIYADLPLDSRRKKIGWAALVIFVLTFTPVPVTII
jgi:membrane-associated protease RseP (regulator of RpoE activity)